MNTLLAFLATYGLAAIFLVTLAARVGIPIPAAPMLVAAGALRGPAELSLLAVAAASILANLAGDAVWFAAGRLWGERVMRLMCRVSLSPDHCMHQSAHLIVHWGGSSLIAAKFVPGVSVVAAPMAGALGMSWVRFAVYGLVSGGVWTLVFLGLGYACATHVEKGLSMVAGEGILGGAVFALLLLGFLGYRWLRRRARLRGSAPVRLRTWRRVHRQVD